MVDTAKIMTTLTTYFTPDGEFHVEDDGSVTAYGSVTARRAIPHIPVRFGRIDGDVRMPMCTLESLENLPPKLGGRLEVHGNKLRNCIGMPTTVLGMVDLANNPLETLDGFSKNVGSFVDITYTLTLPLLRLLVARDLVWRLPRNAGGELDQLVHARSVVEKIFDKYMGQGRAAAIECKRELVAAGLEGNARW